MTYTTKDLEKLVERLNNLTGNPATPYTKDENEKFKANIGNYHLDGAYGGYALHQMCSVGGGVNEIFGGHMPKRELFGKIQAMLIGIETTKKEA